MRPPVFEALARILRVSYIAPEATFQILPMQPTDERKSDVGCSVLCQKTCVKRQRKLTPFRYLCASPKDNPPVIPLSLPDLSNKTPDFEHYPPPRFVGEP